MRDILNNQNSEEVIVSGVMFCCCRSSRSLYSFLNFYSKTQKFSQVCLLVLLFLGLIPSISQTTSSTEMIVSVSINGFLIFFVFVCLFYTCKLSTSVVEFGLSEIDIDLSLVKCSNRLNLILNVFFALPLILLGGFLLVIGIFSLFDDTSSGGFLALAKFLGIVIGVIGGSLVLLIGSFFLGEVVNCCKFSSIAIPILENLQSTKDKR